MEIKIAIDDSFARNKAERDTIDLLRRVAVLPLFLKNTKVGEYSLAKYHGEITKEEEESFWKYVANVLSTSYEVLIADNTLTILSKGSNTQEGENRNENNGHQKVEQTTKKAAKPRLFSKTRKVSKKSE